MLAAGWQEVDPPRRARQAPDDAAEAVEVLPPVRVQDAVETRQAETLTKHTKAPPRYSDATLLGAMETAGKMIDDEELRLAMKDAGLGTPQRVPLLSKRCSLASTRYAIEGTS